MAQVSGGLLRLCFLLVLHGVAVILKAGELPFRGEVPGEGCTCYSDRLQCGRERGVRLEAYGGHPVPVPISDALRSSQSVS